jgi:type IV pilus assembly protein PilC
MLMIIHHHADKGIGVAEFAYLAIDAKGQRVRGRVSSSDLRQAEQDLLAVGIEPIRLSKAWWLGLSGVSRVPTKEIIAFTHQLGYLLKASVPLLDILADIQRHAHLDYPRLAPIITEINRQLTAGQTLSTILSAYPKVFDAVYVGAVLAGEQSGQLAQVLIDLHERLLWLDGLRQRVRQLLTYPLLVLSVILGVTGVLMTQLVPQLLVFLRDSGKPITALTESLMLVSDWLRHDSLTLLLIASVAWLAWRLLLGSVVSVQRWRDHLLLNLSLIGRIQYALAMMRLARVMSLLYSAGLPLQKVLKISQQVMGNVYLAEQFEQIEQSILSGKTLTQAFEQTQVFPRMMIQLMRIGEQSGQLTQRLQDVGQHYQHEVDRLLAQVEPWIEPMITLVLALLLGWVLMATIMPIYDAIG